MVSRSVYLYSSDLNVRHRLRLLTQHTKKEREVTIINRRKYIVGKKNLWDIFCFPS